MCGCSIAPRICRRNRISRSTTWCRAVRISTRGIFPDRHSSTSNTTCPSRIRGCTSCCPDAAKFADAMERFGISDGTPCHHVFHREPLVGNPLVVDAAGVRPRQCSGARWRVPEVESESSRDRKRRRTRAPARPLSRRAPSRELVAGRTDVLAAIGAGDSCTINALRPEQHAGTAACTTDAAATSRAASTSPRWST